MNVEVVKSFQLPGAPPYKCGEVITLPTEVGRRLVREGLVKEIKKPRRSRKKGPPENKAVRPTEDK